MSGKAHTTKKTVSSEEAIEEINSNINAEQTTSEESGNTSGQEVDGQVDNKSTDTNFAQMYDMLTERDQTIKQLTSEIASLKKENTNLLLKVNASASADDKIKDPYESFIDSMVKR